MTAETPAPIHVDVWSDIACPWCFIGKRKFEAGLAAYTAGAAPEAPAVTVEYHSFELSPDTPEHFEGSEMEYLAKHKGIPVEQAAQMLARVTEIAASVGLAYDFDNIKHANTVKAHQLLHYAKKQGKQLEAVELLLSAYFEQGRFVGSVESLADLAVELGFDRAAVLRSLSDDEHLAAVRGDQAQAQAYGIQGVPFFVIDQKYGVSGAQEPAAFAEVLATVADERAAAGAEPEAVDA